MKRKTLKVLGIISLLTFNVFACVLGCIAWFNFNQRVDTSGANIQFAGNGLGIDYRIYKYDDDRKEAINVTNDSNALELPEYDSVITSRNVNTPIIFEFIITGLTTNSNEALNIKTFCTENSPTERVLSNIIKLQFAPITTITTNDANTIYEQAVSYFSSDTVPETTFKIGNAKVTEVLYTLTNYQSLISGASLRLFGELNYSEALIHNFNFNITDINTTSFTNDLTLINCYTNETN